MTFTLYEWLYGVAQIAAAVLAIIVGIICVPLFVKSKTATLRSWRLLTLALILFVIEQVIGGLRTFGVIPNTGFWVYSVHVIVSGILALLIAAIVVQIQINRGWVR